MNILFFLGLYYTLCRANPLNQTETTNVKKIIKASRRILNGKEVGDTRAYMVYLREVPGPDNAPPGVEKDKNNNSTWLCGGVIIHEQYILTSAACIEDVNNFYVISGTHRWIPLDEKDECVTYGAMKAVWKCVPQNFVFDGHAFDNILWLKSDIAVVKVEEEFNFKRRVKGCDFIPAKIAFNNVSAEYEKPDTVGYVAGWGSAYGFAQFPSTPSANSLVLLEAETPIISSDACKKSWDERYHFIIDDGMICTKDAADDEMSAACKDNQVKCMELKYEVQTTTEQSTNTSDARSGSKRSLELNPKYQVHTANHTRRDNAVGFGGFCENDHGGPLIVGRGNTAMVVGVIAACLSTDVTHKCRGPFLYTSVWRHRHIIACAIQKDMGTTCRHLLRSMNTEMVETMYNWHPQQRKPSNGNKNPKLRKFPTKNKKKQRKPSRSLDVLDEAISS